MNIKKLLPILLILLTSTLIAKGEDSLLNIKMKPAVKSTLFPQFNLSAYAAIASTTNIDYNAENYKTGKMVDQDTKWLMSNEFSVGPVVDLEIYKILPLSLFKNLTLESKVLYRMQHWSVEENSFNIHSIDNRNSFIYDLGFLKIQYRLIFWLKLPYTRYEALYQLKDPTVNPLDADDKGKYYPYDYTKVDYRTSLYNRHLIGVIVPLENFFKKFDLPTFAGIEMLEYFLKFEIFNNYSALENNEFETEKHGLNIYGDMIPEAGTLEGYNENYFMRYRLYSGFNITPPVENLTLSLNYIYESNFYYEQYDPVKWGETNQSVHTIQLGALYKYDFLKTENTEPVPEAKQEEQEVQEKKAEPKKVKK